MSYFLPGLWHFAAAMAWAVALGVLEDGDPLHWLSRAAFTIPLLLGSAALFFVPDHMAKKGPLKFLHYPLPDWDVLFLGPASHRNWITHSALLPLLALLAAWRFPILMQPPSPFPAIAAGMSVGIGSHLFWDCVGSRNHKIIVVPYWLSMRAMWSRIWLLTGAAIALGTSVHFGVMPQFAGWLHAFGTAMADGSQTLGRAMLSLLSHDGPEPAANEAGVLPTPLKPFPDGAQQPAPSTSFPPREPGSPPRQYAIPSGPQGAGKPAAPTHSVPPPDAAGPKQDQTEPHANDAGPGVSQKDSGTGPSR